MLSNEEKYIFTSELSMALTNGLQIEEGLKMLAGFDSNVSQVAKQVLDFMENQITFIDALKKTDEFDATMLQMVMVSENIGNLDVVLKELSKYYQRQKKWMYQIQDAITYPFVLIGIMFVIVAVLIFKVFPIFENILRQMSMSLTLMNTAKVVSLIGFILLLIALVIGIYTYVLYKKGSNSIYKLPILSTLHRQVEMTKFTNILSMCVSSGYSLLDAMDMLIVSTDYEELKNKLIKVKRRMLENESMASALVHEKVYDQGYGALLLAGDQSGHQDEVLKTLSIHYQEDLDRMLSAFLNRFEPLMIPGLSLLVGFVLISFMLTLMNVLQTLG